MMLVVAVCSSSRSASAATTPTVQVGCHVHTTDRVDYFFPSNTHVHHRLGGMPATATSTYTELQSNTETSCNTPEYTAEDWFPKIWSKRTPVDVLKVNVYYRGDGGVTTEPIPDGAKLLGNEANGDVDFRCGGKNQPTYETVDPIYGCTQDQFRIRVQLPNCWNGDPAMDTNDFAFRANRTCPAGFPRKLIEAHLAIHYVTPPSGLQSPIRVSSNSGKSSIDSMHADIFFTVQDDFYALLQDCGITAPLEGAMPDKCRTGGAV
jgi:uncharacterized protein DUF1996